MDKKAVIRLLEAKVRRCGSQLSAAKDLGVSAQYLSDVMTGKREPGKAMLDGLHLRKVVSYQKAGK